MGANVQVETRPRQQGSEESGHGAEDQGVLGLRLTLLLLSGVSATGGGAGEGCRGRVDAVRASALPERDAAARRGLPPAGVAAEGLPRRPQDGRADQAAGGVAAAAFALGLRGLPV